MEDFRVMFWPFSVPIVAIIAWVTYMIVATLSRHRLRELEIRERIAMIERGMVPPPEVDPRGFDRAMRLMDRQEVRRGTGRHRRAGIIIMGVGFGLMLMIGFAGAAVLYDTSNIIHYYPEDRYVSAAMQLFASIALMFWYVLRLVMGSRN